MDWLPGSLHLRSSASICGFKSSPFGSMTPDLQTLQAIAATNRWSAHAPELVLGGFALLLLALEFVLP